MDEEYLDDFKTEGVLRLTRLQMSLSIGLESPVCDLSYVNLEKSSKKKTQQNKCDINFDLINVNHSTLWPQKEVLMFKFLKHVWMNLRRTFDSNIIFTLYSLLPPKLQQRGLVFEVDLVTMERVWWVTMIVHKGLLLRVFDGLLCLCLELA